VRNLSSSQVQNEKKIGEKEKIGEMKRKMVVEQLSEHMFKMRNHIFRIIESIKTARWPR